MVRIFVNNDTEFADHFVQYGHFNTIDAFNSLTGILSCCVFFGDIWIINWAPSKYTESLTAWGVCGGIRRQKEMEGGRQGDNEVHKETKLSVRCG